MPEGPGKYDDIATAAREGAQALGVVLVVIGGNKGNGLSVQAAEGLMSPVQLALVLREVADEIARSFLEGR